MTALPKFPLDGWENPRGTTTTASKTGTKRRLQHQPSSPTLFPTPQTSVKVRQLPKPTTQPAWLRFLVKVERGTSIATLGLGVAALCAYGLAVMSQHTWYEEYSRLQGLQRQERQLKAANASLKHQMANQAEQSAARLVPQNPENSIFLVPDQSPTPPAPPLPTAQEITPVDDAKTPLGY